MVQPYRKNVISATELGPPCRRARDLVLPASDKSLHTSKLHGCVGAVARGIAVAQVWRMKKLRLHVLALATVILAWSSVAYAGSVTLAWDANTDATVAGYRVYWGTTSGVYTNMLDVRTGNTATEIGRAHV